MKRIFITTFILIAVVFCSSSVVLAADAGYGTVYRLYHAGNQEHLYTPDYNEYTVLQRRGWKGEGNAWISNFNTNDKPVYRLYSPATREHLYTTNRNEVNTLRSRGWSVDFNGNKIFDGIGEISIYRLYHPGIKRHLLTANTQEYRALAVKGWRQEGIAFYGFDWAE